MNKGPRWFVIGMLLGCGSVLVGQDPASDEPMRAPVTPAGVRELPVRGAWMRGDDGELVWVPSFSWEKWKQLNDQAEDVAQGPPEYQIDQLTVSGDANTRVATLEVTLDVVLATASSEEGENDWVRIPIRLDHAVIRSFTPDDEENVRLGVDRAGAGYLCWIRRSAKSKQKIRLQVAVNVTNQDGEQSIRLRCPRVLREATFALSVSQPDLEFRATSNQRPLPVIPSTTDSESTVTTKFTGGDIALRWNRQGPLTTQPRKLEVKSKIVYQIDDLETVSAAVTLDVLNFGMAEYFVVQLPPNMELKEVSDTFELPYELTVLDPDDAPTPDVQFVEVRFKRTLPANSTVSLEATLVSPMDPTKGIMQLAGFRVIGAAPQHGVIDVLTKDDWSVDWNYSAEVQRQRIDEELKDDLAARFHFDRQPFELEAEVRSRPRDVRVDPNIEFYVDSDEVLQEVRLDYEVRGAPIDRVDLDLHGWELLYIGPAETVDRVETMGGHLLVHLRPNQELRKGFVLDLSLRQAIAESTSDLELTAIRPLENQVSPATLTLEGLSGVTITPNVTDNRSVVLDRSSLEPDVDRWVFRQTQFSPGATIRAKIETPMHSVTALIRNRITLVEQSAIVTQRWELGIANGTMDSLRLRVPKNDDSQQSLAACYLVTGESRIQLEPVPADEDSEMWTIRFEKPISGAHVIECSFTTSETEESGSWRVPLIRIEDDRVDVDPEGIVAITHDADIGIIYDDEQITSEPGSARDAVTTLTVDARDENVQFVASPVSTNLDANLIVKHAWLQSTFSTLQRRDRVVFQLEGLTTELRISMPSGVARESIRVVFDGEQRLFVMQQNTLVLDGEIDHDTPLHVLELWYDTPLTSGVYRSIDIDCPRILGVNYQEFGCWQIVAPRSIHLAILPGDMTANHQWDWQGLFWGYQSSLNQQDLEQRAGASTQPSLQADTTNSYLFETHGDLPRTSVVLVSRYVVVWLMSGAVMVVGLALIRFSQLRHPATGFVLGILVLAISQVLPEQALLVAQAAVLGLVLVMMSFAISWYTNQDMDRLQVHGHVTPLDESISVEISGQFVDGDSQVSTATAPAPFQIPATSDSHP